MRREGKHFAERERESKHGLKRWLYWFLLGLGLIMVFKFFDNIDGLADIISNFFSVIAPFIGALIMAYILYLPCSKIEKYIIKLSQIKAVEEASEKEKAKGKVKIRENFLYRHSRVISIAIVYVIVFVILFFAIRFIIPNLINSVIDLVNEIPNYYANLLKYLYGLPENHILRSEPVINTVESWSNIDLSRFINEETIQTYIQRLISTVFSLYDVFVAVVVSVYILTQRRSIITFLSKLTYAVFSEEKFERIRKYFREGNSIFFTFFSSQIIDAILVGIILSIAMNIIGVKYGTLLGTMIGLFNLIPFYGAIVAVGIASIVTILTGGITQALIMFVVVIAIQQIDANIINPKILGTNLQISQILVIFSVTVGGAYLGVTGMFLAVPVATLLKLVIEDYIADRTKLKKEKAKRMRMYQKGLK